jgi:dihydroxyacetone kinase
VAGTSLVHKIAGAMAESGAALTAGAAAARAAAAAVCTMGLALSSCTVPAAGRPGFMLAEIEMGLAIHGEPGVRRGPLEPGDVLVDGLLDADLADLALDNESFRPLVGHVVLPVRDGGSPRTGNYRTVAIVIA